MELRPEDLLHLQLGLHRVPHDAHVCEDERKGVCVETGHLEFGWECAQLAFGLSNLQGLERVEIHRGKRVAELLVLDI